MRLLLCLTLVSLTLAIPACGYLVDGRSSVNQGNMNSPVEKARLSYEFVYKRVFSPSCVSCHAPRSNISFESYSAVASNLPSIERTVIRQRTMPKNGQLTNDQMQILSDWLQIGAPEHSGFGVPTDPTPTATPPIELLPTFQSIRDVIFAPRCISCHSSGGEARQVPLNQLTDLTGSPRDLVVPGNPDESGLILALERDDKKRMPPPTSGAALSIHELDVIRRWIQNGAVN